MTPSLATCDRAGPWRRHIRRVGALVVILCGGLLIFGGLSESAKADRLSIKALSEKRLVTVIITLHDVTPDYRWLSVYGCSAEVTEYGTVCNYAFERQTTYELQSAKKQQLVFWRDLPRGTMTITAVAFDVNHTPLARNQTTIFRGE